MQVVRAMRRLPMAQLAAMRRYSTAEAFVKVEDTQEAGVKLLTLNRPDKLNSLTVEVGEQFKAAMGQLQEDSSLRALVITGAGRAFSAGGDLQFLLDRAEVGPEENKAEMLRFYGRYLTLRSLPVPVIAAVNGAAVGAGMCLAMACDLRLATAKAKMSVNFSRIGIHPGLAATHFLPKLAGPQVAAEMLLTGCMVSGERARETGIVLRTYDTQEEVVAAAIALGADIAAASPVAVREVTATLRAQGAAGLQQALEREAEAQATNYNEKDMLEGLAAVREKREPKYT